MWWLLYCRSLRMGSANNYQEKSRHSWCCLGVEGWNRCHFLFYETINIQAKSRTYIKEKRIFLKSFFFRLVLESPSTCKRFWILKHSVLHSAPSRNKIRLLRQHFSTLLLQKTRLNHIYEPWQLSSTIIQLFSLVL